MVYNSEENDGALIHAGSLDFGIFLAVKHAGGAYRERINQRGSRLIGSRIKIGLVLSRTNCSKVC